MRIRDLELIVAVYESGNLTVAARQVGMSEPGLSKQLHVIERRSRLRFFDRGRGGAALTEAGRAFVEHARVSIKEYHRALHEARETQQAERHTLRIGTSSFLPPALIELLRPIELRLYRNFSIEVVAEYCFDRLLQLQRHQIDLALVNRLPKRRRSPSRTWPTIWQLWACSRLAETGTVTPACRTSCWRTIPAR